MLVSRQDYNEMIRDRVTLAGIKDFVEMMIRDKDLDAEGKGCMETIRFLIDMGEKWKNEQQY